MRLDPLEVLLTVSFGAYTWGAIAGCGWGFIKDPSVARAVDGAVAAVIFVWLLSLMSQKICLAIRGR